jgi:predicted PurR-regulated permease PerM
MQSASKKSLSTIILVSALVITGAVLAYTLRFFLDAFLGAVIFYVLFRKFMRYLTNVRKWRRGLSAVLIILISLLIIVIPITIVLDMIIPRITLFFSEGSITMSAIRELDEKISARTGFQLLSEQNIESMQAKAGVFITDFFSTSIGVLTSLILMYFVLYYMLVNTGKMEKNIMHYLPFNRSLVSRFTSELQMQTFSNAIGAPMLALIQGLVAALGYWIFQVEEPLFWGIMTGFFSFVPVIGTAAIWLPASIFQYSEGFHWQGIGIFLYGLVVIGLLDNVIRFIFQKKYADVHPLVTVIGVIAGITLFGIPGIIFGPLLISYFLLLLKIFNEEYRV